MFAVAVPPFAKRFCVAPWVAFMMISTRAGSPIGLALEYLPAYKRAIRSASVTLPSLFSFRIPPGYCSPECDSDHLKQGAGEFTTCHQEENEICNEHACAYYGHAKPNVSHNVTPFLEPTISQSI